MHHTLTVALPGDINASELRGRLEALMARFDEDLEVELHRNGSAYAEPFDYQLTQAKAYAEEEGRDISDLSDAELVREWNGDEAFDTDGWPMTTANPDGHWDWWVIGGRWGGRWVLREGAAGGPLATEDSAFGPSPEAGQERRTDNARLADLAPECFEAPYAFIDLDGQWHTRWIGPTRAEARGEVPNNYETWEVDGEEFAERFLKFIAELPENTWLVNVDYHS